MRCVKCDGELERQLVGDVEVDQCQSCHGVWFDFGELERALDHADYQTLMRQTRDLEGHDRQRGRCPVCGGEGKLTPVIYVKWGQEITMDTCAVCFGQWLDGKQIKALKEAGFFENVRSFFKRLLD